MHRPVRKALTAIAALSAAVALAPNPGAAQDGSERIHIYVGAPGRAELPIALPKPLSSDPAATEFYETLSRDLELSGWFRIIDPAAFIEPAGTGIKTGQFKWEDWDTVGAAALAKTGLAAPSAGKLRAEAWVYDVSGRRKLGAKAFTTDAAQVRSLAHRVANEIIFQITGERAPFNTRFAFSGNFTGNKEIYVVDFDGYGRQAITKNGSINLNPSWHPRGSAIAFTSFSSGNPDLYVADLVKGEIRRLSSRAGLNTGAAWSPGGGSLAITLAPSGNPDIFALDPASGKEFARLTKEPGIDVSPCYSPDGSQIAFVSDRSGGAQIYVMNSDGSGVRRVTFQGGSNTDPSWSPDGTRLAYVARDGVFDVFTVRLDGTGLTRITQSAGDNEDPSWSPDGHYIGFASNRTGNYQIWMSTADGVRQVQLTDGKGTYMNPTWSPSLEW